jgi:hypothetical protein
MLNRIMTRLSMGTEDPASRAAPTARALRVAEERVRPAIDDEEDAGLVWPPRTPIETYDAEKHQIVAYRSENEKEAAHQRPHASGLPDSQGPSWREVLRRSRRPLELAVLVLAIVAVVETPYLLVLLRKPVPSASIPAPPPPVASPKPDAAIPAAAAAVDPPTATVAAPPPVVAERTEVDSAAPTPGLIVPPAPGWLSMSLPIQLQIFENGRFVGTSDGSRVMLAAGSHNLELVNESVQFRERRSIQIRSGKVTPLVIALPTGRLQVNAIPWSEVLIDGERAGDTPLGNLQLPIGPHRIVFRHPDLGEQARTAVISVGALTRLSVDLRK